MSDTARESDENAADASMDTDSTIGPAGASDAGGDAVGTGSGDTDAAGGAADGEGTGEDPTATTTAGEQGLGGTSSTDAEFRALQQAMDSLPDVRTGGLAADGQTAARFSGETPTVCVHCVVVL